jgi:hypothetical protein
LKATLSLNSIFSEISLPLIIFCTVVVLISKNVAACVCVLKRLRRKYPFSSSGSCLVE